MSKKILIPIALFASANLFAASDNLQSTQRQIYMLEYALAPKTPQAVAQTWAQAAKNRNGAVQYMLLCPSLQKTNLATLEQLNWVTGASSPQIQNYQIINKGLRNQTWQYDIRYQMAMNNKKIGSTTDHLQILKVNPNTNSSQQWCISQFNLLSPSNIKPGI